MSTYPNNTNSYSTYSSYSTYPTQASQTQFVERNREVVHELTRSENHENDRQMYKGGRVFRDADSLLTTFQTKPVVEETVKSSYNYHVPEYTYGGYPERTQEIVHEISAEKQKNSREVYKGGRVFRDEDGIMATPTYQFKPAEETVKSSYNCYVSVQEPQFSERTKEVVHEISAEKQKNSREVYKGGRVFRDEDGIMTTYQSKPAEETVKSSYNSYATSEESGFVSRTREFTYEKSNDYKATHEVQKGGRNWPF